VRHEEAAAFMACAYAKYTGKLGVCLATSGPGGIHLLNGLYDAKMDSQPVLAITGMHFHDLIGTMAQQDVELDKLFEDVSVFNQRVMGPSHVEGLADLACRTAFSYRGVAHITFPTDLQEKDWSRKHNSKRNVPYHTSDVCAQSARLPSVEDLRNAAEILNNGKKVAILAGQGALHAGEQLEEAAEKLAAPIIKALLGKAAVPDDSPYTTGGIGLLGTKPSQTALKECDTLLIVGSSFPYIEFLPKPGKARGVQIELDPKRIGLRYPVEVGLVGDSGRALQELLPLLEHKKDRSFLDKAHKGMQEWRVIMQKQAERQDVPMKPHVVAAELENAYLPMRSSPAIPARIRPGGRGTSRPNGDRCSPARATWPPWRAGFPTPSRPRSPIRRGNAWHSSAMEPFPCSWPSSSLPSSTSCPSRSSW
jgi:pyruvate dehydrogenase (quinone)/pyruvate oxidase